MTVKIDEKFQLLPDELIERILAMIPFPQICKARVLSKSWQARFWPVESQDNQEKRLLATSFQNQVREQSTNWITPCPICVDLNSQQRLFAYDCVSDCWPNMPSLSFLPEAILHDLIPKLPIFVARRSMTYRDDPLRVMNGAHKYGADHINCLQLVDGALLLVTSVSESDYPLPGNILRPFESDSPLSLHVANLLTQTWRRLPQAPEASKYYVAFVKLVTQPALGKYKVIVFYFGTSYCFARCYDSKSNSWRKTDAVGMSEELGSPTHLDGVLSMKVGYGWKSLLAFNVEEETFENIQFGGMNSGRGEKISLVACNGNLLMISQGGGSLSTVVVTMLDLPSRRGFEVARGPPAAHLRRRYSDIDTNRVSDGVTSICFRLLGVYKGPTDELRHDAMLVYNMCTRAWCYVPLAREKWAFSSFQTNCDPFLGV